MPDPRPVRNRDDCDTVFDGHTPAGKQDPINSMNLKHLNDAFDFTKKGVLADLAEGGVIDLTDLLVLPIITDQRAWKVQHYQRYAAILGVARDAILLSDPFGESTTATASTYFCDPDIGIEPPKSPAGPKHTRGEYLQRILNRHPDAIVIIYQHAELGKSGKMRERLMKANAKLRSYNIRSIGLDLGQIGFVFCATITRRLRVVQRHYTTALSDKARTRLVTGCVAL